MIAGEAAALIMFIPPILAIVAAFVALTLLRVRSVGAMVLSTILGWVAVFALPGIVGRDWLVGNADEQIIQSVVCAVAGATAGAVVALVVRRLRGRTGVHA